MNISRTRKKGNEEKDYDNDDDDDYYDDLCDCNDFNRGYSL